MTSDLWPQIIIAASTLTAAFLGFVFAGRNEARRDQRAAETARSVRAEDRRAAALDARHAFQLQTLLDLQDALQLMARLTGRAMHFDHMQARKGQYTQLPPTYDEEMLANSVNVTRLGNRILDDDLRATIEQFRTASAETNALPNTLEQFDGAEMEAAADQALRRFSAQVDITMARLGAVLRSELDWDPIDGDPSAPTRR